MYSFEIFADYYQLYLMDDEQEPDYPSDVTDLDCSNMAKVAPYIVAVYTARNMTVPLTVRVNTTEPEVNLDQWDHVVGCSVDVPSGKLVVIGCTDYLPDAQRLDLQPGTYQVRICYGNLDSLSANRLYGDDYYVVDLWQGQTQELKVLKQWQNAPYVTQ